MLDSEEWKEMIDDLSVANKESKCDYFSSDDFAWLFCLFKTPDDYSLCTTTNVYFGEDKDYANEYVMRLFRPFDAAGLIALGNKTIGGSLFTLECKKDEDEHDFVVRFLNEFRKKYFKSKNDFYVDYGWFLFEANEINIYN